MLRPLSQRCVPHLLGKPYEHLGHPRIELKEVQLTGVVQSLDQSRNLSIGSAPAPHLLPAVLDFAPHHSRGTAKLLVALERCQRQPTCGVELASFTDSRQLTLDNSPATIVERAALVMPASI